VNRSLSPPQQRRGDSEPRRKRGPRRTRAWAVWALPCRRTHQRRSQQRHPAVSEQI
jgi:hypothetical protein